MQSWAPLPRPAQSQMLGVGPTVCVLTCHLPSQMLSLEPTWLLFQAEVVLDVNGWPAGGFALPADNAPQAVPHGQEAGNVVRKSPRPE